MGGDRVDAGKFSYTAQTLCNWVRRAGRGRGLRPGPNSEEQARIKALEREKRELRQASEIPAQRQRVFCPGGARPLVQAMTALIDEHCDVSGVEPI